MQRADDPGGERNDGRRQVYLVASRGVAVFSDKFDITKHPRYKYLTASDKENTFDIERYMKRRPTIVKPDEPFTNAIDGLQTLVIALGGGLCVWGGCNLLDGYGRENPFSNADV